MELGRAGAGHDMDLLGLRFVEAGLQRQDAPVAPDGDVNLFERNARCECPLERTPSTRLPPMAITSSPASIPAVWAARPRATVATIAFPPSVRTRTPSAARGPFSAPSLESRGSRSTRIPTCASVLS